MDFKIHKMSNGLSSEPISTPPHSSTTRQPSQHFS